jgi:hypothetical protein
MKAQEHPLADPVREDFRSVPFSGDVCQQTVHGSIAAGANHRSLPRWQRGLDFN